ncbi:MAG TPA: hypothetical protein VFN71_14440 [Methylomirabilota bacterium]|nr:hypothetical protein [Methylomirabilota bacterium]
MIERLILVAPRFDYEFYEFLRRKFAGDPTVVVIAERRAWQRRKQASMRDPDRRSGDRRRRSPLALVVAGRRGQETPGESPAPSGR